MFQSNAFSSLPDDNTTGGVDDFVFDGDDDDWILDEEDDFEKEGGNWIAVPSDSAMLDELTQFVVAFPNAFRLQKNDDNYDQGLCVKDSNGRVVCSASIESYTDQLYSCAISIKLDKRIVEGGMYSVVIPEGAFLLFGNDEEDYSPLIQPQILIHYNVSGIVSEIDVVHNECQPICGRVRCDLLGRQFRMSSKGIFIIDGRKVLK